MKRTDRGFSIYDEFEDSRGNMIRVQQSSACGDEDFNARDFCWVFAHNPFGEDAIIHLGRPQSISPHLTKGQARRLANALLAFCDDASK